MAAEHFLETVSVAEVPLTDAWLGPRERAAMSRFAFPRRRAEWRAGRWAARKAIARFGEIGADVEILSASDGAPEVWNADGRVPVNVSISHRAGTAAAMAAAGAGVGCDVELVEPRGPQFAADWFTDAECAALDQAPFDERDLLATVMWSAKETVLKVLRRGLRVDTREVETSIGRGTFEATVDGVRMSGWWKRCGELVITGAAEERKQ